MCENCTRPGRDFSTLALADWQRYHALFEEGVFAAITPDAAVAARKTPQSTNPDAVAVALAELKAWLIHNRETANSG